MDTGAQVTCMPAQYLKWLNLKKKDLLPSKKRLTGASGASLQVIGEIILKVQVNSITKEVAFVITGLGGELLLGYDFCIQFKLVNIADTCKVKSVTKDIKAVSITEESAADYSSLRKKWKKHLPLGKKTGDPLEDLKRIFPETFDGGVGLFDGELDLRLAEDAKPVQLPPRAVPRSIMAKLKEELDKMEEQGIIRPCPETTDWVHNLVIAKKKNGDLRICLDPRALNKALIRNIHYTASWEDAEHSFANGKYFSTLDAKSGYWTQKLSKEAQLMTAFNTPFHKYCFLRMPFGLSISAEVFQAKMDQALEGIPGTFPCADDVKVQGSTSERHDIHLLQTVEHAQKAGIKFNPDKCCIRRQTIKYFGRLITPNGIKPCLRKVQAITMMTAPGNKQELQSFLGSVNFMSMFVKNLTQKTHLMRGLLKSNVTYQWTGDMQKEFQDVKDAIAEETLLAHFDPSQPVCFFKRAWSSHEAEW